MDNRFPQVTVMRSVIYTDLAKEEYRHKLLAWHMLHVADSISQFEPYVTKYAFYQALPVPPEGERFGVARFHMCEHNWLVNPFDEHIKTHAFTEYMPLEVLKWQNSVPDDEDTTDIFLSGDEFRAADGSNGCRPFVFAFMPMWWEEDIKGKARTIEDGFNYRWQFLVRYPDEISVEEGELWLHQVLDKFAEMPEVTRILTSRVYQDINDCKFHRCVEMWFDGPNEWYKACVTNMADMPKPDWAQQDKFPFLKPMFYFTSIMVPDIPYSDNLVSYRGNIMKR